jgi:hypothetical protein
MDPNFTKGISLAAFCFLFISFSEAQTLEWSYFAPNTAVLSSPRAADLNNDGVLDIVIGGGVDGFPKANGIMAIDGATGAALWMAPCDNEMFGSAVFLDITSDGIPDVFIGGRHDQFYALNGQTGAEIWRYITPAVPTDTILNIYNPQIIPDMNNDGIKDLLISHGGQHHKPASDQNRRPGQLKILSGIDGSILHSAFVPDGKETYCSPLVVDFYNTGTTAGLWIVYGTGGENATGSLWAVELSDLLSDDISGSVEMVRGNGKGFIAPASLADLNKDGFLDVVAQSYDGSISGFDFKNNDLLWKVDLGGCESSSESAIGNFTGDMTPDVFALVNKGLYPNYTAHSYLLIDGAKGTYTEYPISDMAYASMSAVDLTGDGRDEVIASLNKSYNNGVVDYFKNEMKIYNFQAGTVTDLITPVFNGINLGSTAWIGDMDNDSKLDVVFAFRADSSFINGAMGIYVKRVSLTADVPVAGIAWGGYMGTSSDGHYTDDRTFCGGLTIGRTATQPTCNSTANGSINITVSGGTAPYTYVWSNGAITQDISGILPGTYIATVVDATACMDTAIITVAPPFYVNFTITDNACPTDMNGVINLTSGTPGSTVFILNGNLVGTINNTGQLSNLATGVYDYHYTSTTSCQISDVVVVGPLIKVTFSISLESAPGAQDGVAVATASGGTGPYTYQWNDPANTMGNTLTGLSNGSSYTVSVTGSNPCHTGSGTVNMSSSSTTGIFSSSVITMAGFSLYPNPATDITILEVDKNIISTYDLFIFDAMGGLVRRYTAQNEEKLHIDRDNLSPGLYQAILKHDKGNSSFKIMFEE